MPIVDFGDLKAETSRIWIFPITSPLTDVQRGQIESRLPGFLNGWKAHGDPLHAAFAVKHDRFLLIGADESEVNASGCSIDALFRGISELLKSIGCELGENHSVYYLSDGKVCEIPREQFAVLVERGDISPETVVFNNSVTKLSDFVHGKWETSFVNSWHAKAFPLPTQKNP